MDGMDDSLTENNQGVKVEDPNDPNKNLAESGSTEYFTPIPKGQYPLNSGTSAPKEPEIPKAVFEQVIDKVEQPSTPPPGSHLETLRTFKNDVAYAVQNQKQSVVKMAVAEQERKIVRKEIQNVMPRAVQKDPYKESKKNVYMIFASVFLIVLGVGAGIYAFTVFRTPPAAVVITKTGRTLVAADQEKEIRVANRTPEDVQSLAKGERNQTHTPGSIVDIYLVDEAGKKVPIDVFAATLGLKMPQTLVRSLDAGTYAMGFHMIKGGKLFFVFKPTYFEGSYPSMLGWESTMLNDLSVLFENKSASGIFEDKVIKNLDTRIIYNDEGNLSLIYTFINKNYLVITEDEETLVEVTRRISQAAKTVQ